MPQPLRGPKLAEKMAKTAEKRKEALALRISGMTQAQIAARMGVTKMSVSRWLGDAIADIPKENAIECKAMALQKLEAQELRLHQMRATPKLSIGDKIKIETMLNTVAVRRAKLEGTDAPTRAEFTGKDGAPLLELTMSDLQAMPNDQLQRVIRGALRSSAGRGGGVPDSGEAHEEARGARRSH